MPKQKGVFKIKGTMGDFAFYQSNGEMFARQKGGVDGSRIASDPAFERTRENGKEFGSSANAGKLLRKALRSLILNASDRYAVSRLTQIMTRIKNMDGNSARGERNVGVGIQDPKAKLLLKGFEFNNAALLSSVLSSSYIVSGSGDIDIPSVNPAEDLVFPDGSTHVSFKGGRARIDFVNGTAEFFDTNVVNLKLDQGVSAVKLTPTGMPLGVGTDLFLLRLSFYQEINGVQYKLKDEAHNALSIIEVL